jgi:septum formation protein
MRQKLILASASPRRLALLRQIGIEPEILPVFAEEIKEGKPEQVVLYNAKTKLQAAISQKPGRDILAADTVVALDGKILGKPETEEMAVRMLTELSGRRHQVYTGLAAFEAGEAKSLYVVSEVEFFPLSEETIKNYVKTGEPLDKAGAYGIQGRGALLVKSINGDYNNIVGLPLASLSQLLTLNRYIDDR